MVDKLSLAELQLIIRDALYTSVPGTYWISAEISEIKENYSGHCYLELIDKEPGEENIKAKARAVIWANRYRMLRPFFESTTGESLKEGLRILIKVTLEYHSIYGISLIISDIDPAYSIGEMAIKRLQIIRRLEKEGVIQMNKDHAFPLIPRRIAIISSGNAAGYTDFIKQLHGNNNGYIFYTALFESVMQGSETSVSIINALDRISEKTELFDVVVIIRGGGSQTDLSWFDNYNIAYHITQFPLPIITGIGHEKDMTVADLVANISVKTPTAVADLLINRMSETEIYITEIGNNIIRSSLDVVRLQRNRIDTLTRNLTPAAKVVISKIQEKVSSIKIGLVSNGKDYLTKAVSFPVSQRSRLESVTKTMLMEKSSIISKTIINIISSAKILLKQENNQVTEANMKLSILDPANVMKRGFTITLFKGKILKNRNLVSTDDIIDTRFSNGVVKSKVIREINKSSKY
jgi:exodeoxyribonuclease VII large subunit